MRLNELIRNPRGEVICQVSIQSQIHQGRALQPPFFDAHHETQKRV